MESDLVAKLKDRDPDAVLEFDNLYRGRALRFLARSRIVPLGSEEDVYQEVLMDLPERIQLYRPRGHVPFEAWFRKVLASAALNHRRGETRRQNRERTYVESLRGGRVYDEGVLRGRVAEAFDTLSPEVRGVLEATVLGNMEPTDYAKAAGLTPEQVRDMKRRGLNQLRRRIG